MAEINFPEGLPLPLRERYGLEHVDTVLRTQMASGRTRRRQRFTNAPSRVNAQWVMSSAEAQLFEAWYWAPYDSANPALGGIQGGTLPFNVKMQSPIGIRQYDDVTFLEQYQGPELFGIDHWRFTATLEIAKRPVLPPSSLEFPQFILYSGIIDIVATVKWPPQT